MIDEKTVQLLVERLIRRVEQANTYFLIKLGSSIKQLRDLTPSQAQQLIQILKYGGNYEQIIKQIAKYVKMNIDDLDQIFSQYAKKDDLFYEKFYKYRNIPFVENDVLKKQRIELTKIVKNEMYNFTRSNVLGYTIKDIDGRVQFLGLRETYNRVLDEAFLNVSQGKESFDSAMSNILKQIGGSGLKTLQYESGRSIRLDSATRMHLNSRLRELHNERQKIIGDIIKSDGVEITVHTNPAPDHEKVQGRQFSTVKPSKNQLSEWEKLQSGKKAKDYTGKEFTLDHDHKNGYRPISEMNCYHYIFTIILGLTKPEYSDEQLNAIIDRNNKGFDYEGKHYTMYEGLQLQRNLERQIRKQKDIQTLAKASNNIDLISQSQMNISFLTRKYYQLSQTSGLPTKLDRIKNVDYKYVAKSKLK